ncbi:MAG: hypothetical protein ACOC4R_01990 [Bacteroidota bacterium]
MKKLKTLIVAAAIFFMLGAASSASASGHPLLMGVTDGQEVYYILVKFDQNQFSLQEAQYMSQYLGQMTGASGQLGYQTVVVTPYELIDANPQLGDADLVKGAMKQLGWISVFIDLSYKQAPVAEITNLNMDMSLYPYMGKEMYLMSLGINNKLMKF